MLDSLHGHTTNKIKKFLRQEMNTDIAIIPRGMTSQLHMMDVAVNKLFKDNAAFI